MSVKKESRFEFGKNWENFVDYDLTDKRIDAAQESLRELLGTEDLQGRTFLDIGCGSGLFSLAACLLGAEHILSFDYDQDSVRATEKLREKRRISPEKWQVMQGSILDDALVADLGQAAVVYSWGVLHHTGDMWRAIDNAVGMVKPGGLFVMSIYNDVARHVGGSGMWLKIKRVYVRSPKFVRKLMEYAYVLNFVVRHLITFRNPFRAIRNYGRRGMKFWRDIRDWVGGYPYEYATAGDVFNYVNHKHGLQLKYMTTTHTVGCNQFVFYRPVGVRMDRYANTRINNCREMPDSN